MFRIRRRHGQRPVLQTIENQRLNLQNGMISNPPASLHGAEEGEFVGVLEAAAGGQALGDAGETAVFAAEEVGQIVGGGLALDIGAEREDDYGFKESPRPVGALGFSEMGETKIVPPFAAGRVGERG